MFNYSQITLLLHKPKRISELQLTVNDSIMIKKDINYIYIATRRNTVLSSLNNISLQCVKDYTIIDGPDFPLQ